MGGGLRTDYAEKGYATGFKRKGRGKDILSPWVFGSFAGNRELPMVHPNKTTAFCEESEKERGDSRRNSEKPLLVKTKKKKAT